MSSRCRNFDVHCCAVQVAVEDIIADGKLRLAVQPVFDETQLAAALQVTNYASVARSHCFWIA